MCSNATPAQRWQRFAKASPATCADALDSSASSNRSSPQRRNRSTSQIRGPQRQVFVDGVIMRGDAEVHQMIAPGTLAGVLELIAGQPGEWTPIAGGTELMVAHAAGRLAASKLVSLWGIADLRFIGT